MSFAIVAGAAIVLHRPQPIRAPALAARPVAAAEPLPERAEPKIPAPTPGRPIPVPVTAEARPAPQSRPEIASKQPPAPRRPSPVAARRPAGAFTTVGPDESLADVAVRVYGDPEAATLIWKANRDALSSAADRPRAGSLLRTPDAFPNGGLRFSSLASGTGRAL